MKANLRNVLTTGFDSRIPVFRLAQASALKPARGWLRAVRSVLGFSQEQVAKKISMTRQSYAGLEAAEQRGAISLNSLQRAAEAIYSPEGSQQVKSVIAFYLENARLLREGIAQAGVQVFGGVNAPYIWLKTPRGLKSWEFFDQLLTEAHLVGTPGSGFGSCGEGPSFSIAERLAATARLAPCVR